MPNDALSALVRQTQTQRTEYERGFEAGKKQTLEELTPKIEKIASVAAGRLQEQLENQEAFRGQVAAHVAAAELARYKESMRRGFCWQCGTRAAEQSDSLRRCSPCTSDDR